MKKDYFTLAFRNLKHRGLRTFLTVVGIFIGIAAVVSLISVGDGLKLAVNSQFGISSTEVITVQAGGLNSFGPPGSGVDIPLTRDDAEAIGNLNGVKLAIPRNIVTGFMEYNDIRQIGFAGSIPDDKEQREFVYEIIGADEFEEGKKIEDESAKVILGYNFLDGEKNGYQKDIHVGDNVIINDEDFQVYGILKKQGSFIFDNSLLISDTQIERISDVGNNVDLIAVVVKDKDDISEVAEEVAKLMRKRRNVDIGNEDFEISTPEGALGTVNSILTGVQIFIAMIAAISIIVGTVGIVNTMTTAVMERRKEIGIMKSIGARNSDIFYQFFIEAGILGLVGGIAGVIFGTAAGYYGTLAIANWIGSDLVPGINFPLIIFALIGSFIIGAVSGIVPALQAAKLNPVEALRV
jgi:putative ABC transport system permease protein